MADLISKAALFNALCSASEKAEIFAIINSASTIDAVEVVRCKDCKHWKKDTFGCTDHIGRCDWAMWMCGENGYCIYAERKEGADNG